MKSHKKKVWLHRAWPMKGLEDETVEESSKSSTRDCKNLEWGEAKKDGGNYYLEHDEFLVLYGCPGDAVGAPFSKYAANVSMFKNVLQ